MFVNLGLVRGRALQKRSLRALGASPAWGFIIFPALCYLCVVLHIYADSELVYSSHALIGLVVAVLALLFAALFALAVIKVFFILIIGGGWARFRSMKQIIKAGEMTPNVIGGKLQSIRYLMLDEAKGILSIYGETPVFLGEKWLVCNGGRINNHYRGCTTDKKRLNIKYMNRHGRLESVSVKFDKKHEPGEFAAHLENTVSLNGPESPCEHART